MSRIGKKPIIIPQGVKVEQSGRWVKVEGALGRLQMRCHPHVQVKIDREEGRIWVENQKPEDREGKQLHGTTRALIANMIRGVGEGFQKMMEIYGAGYSVKQSDDKLLLQVGFAKTVERRIPDGIKVNIMAAATRGDDVPARFQIQGVDKCLVGQFAADVRKIRPPEPYKGKGVRYAQERVRRKVGKAFTSGPV